MKHTQTSSQKENFKEIKGIGPATERYLHDAGLISYTDLASHTPETLAKLLSPFTRITAERIAQEGWIEQAAALTPEQDTAVPSTGQRYATFTVELLLDEQSEVRRTRVTHVQQEDHKDMWPGWQAERLLTFMTDHAQLLELDPAVSPALSPTPHKPSSSYSALGFDLVDENSMTFIRAASARSTPLPTPAETAALPTPAETAVATQPADPALKSSLSVHSPHGLLAHGQQFEVNLHIASAALTSDHNGPFRYQAAVFAFDLKSGQRQQIGLAQGMAPHTDQQLQITVPVKIQTPGTYRLEAELNVAWMPQTSDLTTTTKGTLVHIY